MVEVSSAEHRERQDHLWGPSMVEIGLEGSISHFAWILFVESEMESGGPEGVLVVADFVIDGSLQSLLAIAGEIDALDVDLAGLMDIRRKGESPNIQMET